MENSLAARAECIECKEQFTIDSSIVKKEEYKFEGKQSMWLTHYDCPKCGRTHFCQIDDQNTNRLLVEATKIMARIAKCKQHGQGVPKKLQLIYKKNSTDLAVSRTKLMKQYSGCWFEDADGHTTKVEFVQ